MARGIRIAVESELETVAHAADRIRRLCAGKLPDDFIQEVEIAFVEALNNVIEHGHTDNKGTIKVSCRLSEKNIVIEIFDQSVTDASEHYSRPDPTSEDFSPDAIDALPEGGMGLPLIHAIMDEVEYSTVAGGHRLRMVKWLPGSS